MLSVVVPTCRVIEFREYSEFRDFYSGDLQLPSALSKTPRIQRTSKVIEEEEEDGHKGHEQSQVARLHIQQPADMVAHMQVDICDLQDQEHNQKI